MAYGNNNNRQRVQTDRFGNPYILFTALEVVKKDGEIISGVFKGFAEIKGKLYKVEVSERQKEHKSGRSGMWVKMTEMKKNNNNQSF